MNRIAAAVHDRYGYTTFVYTDGSFYSDREAGADAKARKLGQRIVRNPDWTCTVEDLPKPPTTIELIMALRSDTIPRLRDLHGPWFDYRLDAIVAAHRREIADAKAGRS